jgi:hypothetical protein
LIALRSAGTRRKCRPLLRKRRFSGEMASDGPPTQAYPVHATAKLSAASFILSVCSISWFLAIWAARLISYSLRNGCLAVVAAMITGGFHLP